MDSWSEIDNNLLNGSWNAAGKHHKGYKRLRDEDPVHWTEDESFGRSYWAITRYADIKSVLEQPRAFSSRWDSRVPRSPKRLTPEERFELGYDVSIGTNDDPLHSLYRRPGNKHFSVPAIARLKSSIEEVVDELIADVAERGECDLFADIAMALPTRVMLGLLGVPKADWDYINQASLRWFAAADPRYMVDNDPWKTQKLGMAQLRDYAAELAAERRQNPRDDLTTAICNLEVDGDKLSDHEVHAWISLVIGAGLETTRNAAAVGAWALMTHPDQRSLLLERPELTKPAVEEVVRWVTPAKNRLRIATEDITFQENRLRAGDWVICFKASGNKDERAFTDPFAFNILREENEHLGWGAGPHQCLGRNLARLELAIFFPRLFQALPDIAPVNSGEPAWTADAGVTGFTELPVSFTPTRTRAKYDR